MGSREFLGEFEQMVLLAVLRLEDRAHVTDIAEELERRARRDVSRGALYTTLDRLEGKGYVRWEIEAHTSEKKGSRKRRFEVTPAGVEALITSREALLDLWDGLEGLLTRPG